jgi:large subunit ribosomal protein L20
MTGAKKILQWAKGFRGRAKNCISIARERVEKSLQYVYRDRRTLKRDMRSLWIQRINAGAREHGVRRVASCWGSHLYCGCRLLLSH